MRAGIRIRDGSISGVNWCTMGFLVTDDGTSNQLLLTAGHCSWNGVGNAWYHKAYGKVGAEVDTGAYGEDGYDVMIVGFPDAQASKLIYGESTQHVLRSARDPITNEGVCFSGAKTGGIVCGTVTDNLRSWVSQTCDCNVWGGDTNLAPLHGDSGAPLYHRAYMPGPDPYWLITPIGIVDHENGYFAWVTAAEWIYSVHIYY